MGLSIEQAAYLVELQKRKKPTSVSMAYNSNMNGVNVFDKARGYRLVGAENFPNHTTADIVDVKYSDFGGANKGLVTCYTIINKENRRKCIDNVLNSASSTAENERLKLENERLAIEMAEKTFGANEGLSTGAIIGITLVSIAALTGMVLLIKKYGK